MWINCDHDGSLSVNRGESKSKPGATHSPEPWKRGNWPNGSNLIRSKGSVICGMVQDGCGTCHFTTPSGDDMDRIVACVNFCRGLSTEWLNNNQNMIYEWT